MPKPLPGMPTMQIRLLVPASTVLRDGTIEEVALNCMPLESERVKEALLKKFGASHPPDKKTDPKFEEYMEVKVTSPENSGKEAGVSCFLGSQIRMSSLMQRPPN